MAEKEADVEDEDGERHSKQGATAITAQVRSCASQTISPTSRHSFPKHDGAAELEEVDDHDTDTEEEERGTQLHVVGLHTKPYVGHLS